MEAIQSSPAQRAVSCHPAPNKNEPGSSTTGIGSATGQHRDVGEKAAEAGPESNTDVQWKPTRRFLLAFISLQLVISAVCLEVTALPTALPIMSAELGATALQAFWAGTSYMLASTVVQPPVASMSHILGRRVMLYLSAAGFGGGSLIVALAKNFNVVLGGRTVQMLNLHHRRVVGSWRQSLTQSMRIGGGLMVLVEILISDLIPLAHRGIWFSINSIMWCVGTAAGPLVGAAFAQYVSWRWIFWINLPIVGLAMIFVTFFLKLETLPGHIFEKLGRFDWLGATLFSVSSAGFLFGITTGGVMFAWGSYQVLIPLLIGLSGILAFIYWEFSFAEEPILEKRMFKTFTATSTYVGCMLQGLLNTASIYFLVLYFQGVKTYSPIMSAVGLLPVTIHLSWASTASGYAVGKVQRYRWALWLGWVLLTVGCGLLMLLGPGTSVVRWVFVQTPLGIGTGILFTPQILCIQASTENIPQFNGHAAAFFSFIRVFGSAVGVAVSGVIFQNAFKHKLEDIPQFADVAEEYSRDATLIVEVIKEMDTGSTARSLMINAYSESLGAIWITLLAFSAAGMLLSFTVKGYSMSQEHVTKQKLVQGEKTPEAMTERGVLE
ncbi:Major Facilitator Superfamily protein [Apiospora marii]|uniref:Major Facilitator Superfamily protein n=1 Tax=Apiospora marii TaxID=335849 RepID=A0ABR1RT19_9PEZI